METLMQSPRKSPGNMLVKMCLEPVFIAARPQTRHVQGGPGHSSEGQLGPALLLLPGGGSDRLPPEQHQLCHRGQSLSSTRVPRSVLMVALTLSMSADVLLSHHECHHLHLPAGLGVRPLRALRPGPLPLPPRLL